MERITTWNRKHVLLADALYAVIISIFFTLMAGTNDSNPGIIAYFDHTVMAFWSFVLMVPVAMRRWKPQMATLLFAGLVVVQLAFGPSMVYADLMAPWMLYSAIVYADPRNSKAFILLAVAIGALASPVIIWSADAGPILNQGVPFDGLSPLETCSGTYIYGLSGDCATTITTSSVAIFIFIAVYLFAAIIVAYWQRARRITVSMMHERNDALQAKEDEERHIAALAERARIARDMHDVVAHTLSIIIIQSDGGRYAGANNPALARQTMETIRHESERALHDMKRLLGVFGGSDHADYADVDALIDQRRVKLVVDLKPALTEEVLRERIAREIADMEPTEFFTELLRKLVPKPLVLTLVHEMDVNGKNYVSKITEEQIGRLIKTLKGFTFPLTDYAPFEYAVVTAGGVRCDEVNRYTMESLKVKGLYFAGEVLDLDANTGGYNLQIAFSTGRLAGQLKQ